MTAVAATLALAALAPRPMVAQDHGGGHHAEHHGGHGAMTATPAGRISVRHEPGENRFVTVLGPYSLPASGNTMRLTPAEVVVVPADGWLTSFETTIVDAQGRILPDEILHHINLVRPDRRELFFPVMQRIAAAGQETGRIGTPFPFGVPVSRGDTLLVAAMIHNPTGRPLDLRIRSAIEYDSPKWLDRVAVQPFHLDIAPPPQGASFDLPPGRSVRTWEGSPAVDVDVLALGGHIHRYGSELRLEEVRPRRSPKVLWRTTPELEPGGQVARVPRKTFLLRGGLELHADRTYRLVAIYENPTGETIPAGGMAEIAGVALPQDDWPDAVRSDPLFMADYASFTRHNPGLGSAMGHQP